MVTNVLYFLPCLTCLFWLVLNPLIHKTGKAFRTMELFVGIIGITTLAEAGILCSNGITMLSFFLAKQFFALLIIPAAFLYLRSILPFLNRKPSIPAWTVIPFSLLFAQVILLFLIGPYDFINSIEHNSGGLIPNQVEKLIHFCSFWLFYGILAIEIIVIVIAVIVIVKKGHYHIQLFNCAATTIAYSLLQVVLVIDKSSVWIVSIASIILACFIFLFSFSGLYHGMAHLRFSDLLHMETNVIIPDHKPENDIDPSNMSRVKAGIAQPSAENTNKVPTPLVHEPVSIIADANQSMADEESLRIRFEDIIVTEQLFLRQGIRITDIASMLETNRTYISRLVNSTYNMSFSDYINTLRIDYAEQYLLHHRDAKQSDIAAACGFPNASAFNNVFKKITGVTPKIWLATNS